MNGENDMNFWKRCREKIDLSQFDLAVKLGVTTSLISAWERDASVPTLTRSATLAKCFGVSREKIESEIVAQTRRIEARALAAK